LETNTETLQRDGQPVTVIRLEVLERKGWVVFWLLDIGAMIGIMTLDVVIPSESMDDLLYTVSIKCSFYELDVM
jgi:hypothetical protein